MFRFTVKPRGLESPEKRPLPFHRFGVGDTVRVSPSRSVATDLVREGGEGVIDGVVLDRRRGYLDICLKVGCWFVGREGRGSMYIGSIYLYIYTLDLSMRNIYCIFQLTPI